MSIGGTLLRALGRGVDYVELGTAYVGDSVGLTEHAATKKFALMEAADEVAVGSVKPENAQAQADYIAGGSAKDEDALLAKAPPGPLSWLAQLLALLKSLKWVVYAVAAIVLGLVFLRLFGTRKD